jgi:DNA-directed RNA polymerase specialized sigma subunit
MSLGYDIVEFKVTLSVEPELLRELRRKRRKRRPSFETIVVWHSRYEVAASVRRALERGVSRDEIAKHLGVSRQRTYQLEKWLDGSPPMEAYLGENAASSAIDSLVEKMGPWSRKFLVEEE